MNKKTEKLEPGDLVCIFWNDASIGSSFTTAGIPVPVKSVGIYVGYAGRQTFITLKRKVEAEA